MIKLRLTLGIEALYLLMRMLSMSSLREKKSTMKSKELKKQKREPELPKQEELTATFIEASMMLKVLLRMLEIS